MTFDEVRALVRLSGGPSPATNIPVVYTFTYGNTVNFWFRARGASKKI